MLIKDNIDVLSKNFKYIHKVNISSKDCKYKFYIDILNKDFNTVKNVLISDIEKLLKSIKNHTKINVSAEDIKKYQEGVDYLSDDDRIEIFGQTFVNTYVEYPKDLYSYEKQRIKKYNLIISGQPIFKSYTVKNDNELYSHHMSKIINFTSNAGAQKKINELVDSILENILLDEVSTINFYVCSSDNNNFYLYILFKLIKEDSVLKKKEEQEELERKQEEERKKQLLKIQEIVNIIKESYNKGKKLKKLYKDDESLFEEKIDIYDKFDFTLGELETISDINNVYNIQYFYSNLYKKFINIINIDNINIPNAFSSYTLERDWYDDTYTYIYLIEDNGHYYKSRKYRTAPRNNWRGD